MTDDPNETGEPRRKVFLGGRRTGRTTQMVAWLMEDPKHRILLTCSANEAGRLTREFDLPKGRVMAFDSQTARLSGDRHTAYGVDDADRVLQFLLQRPIAAMSVETGRRDQTPGYHLTDIERREFGTLGKVMEELEEAVDAERQGVELMVLQELADAVGAIKGYLAAKHPTLTLDDLEDMASVTARAFRAGRR